MKLTLGQYLRQLREERGFSLEQLAQATRINPTYLRALENDEPSLLPSAVQGRGYLRLIAGTFNIDPQPLLAAFPDKEVVLSSPPTEEIPQGEETQPERTEPVSISTTPTVNETTPETLTSEEEVRSETIPPIEATSLEDTQYTPQPVEGSSTFIFSQIGQQFRAQREALGISLEDAERFTRLKARYLRAIEEGQLEQLPSLVQGRGMLRNYAEFLTLDSEAILLQFADGLQRRRLEHLAATAPSRVTTSPAGQTRFPNRFSLFLRKWMTPDLLVGSLLFLILLVFVIWGTARVSGLQDQETQATPPSISEILLNTSDVSGSTIATLAESPTPTVAQNNSLPVQSSPEESQESISQPPTSNDPVQVYVIANQRVWMRVTADNRVAFEGRTIPGSAYPFTAKDSIELTAGNAAGIQIVYNQNNLGNLGGTGDVIRLIFTAQGTVVPTPLFTSTPAPTLPPTFTPQPTPLLPTPTVTPLVP